MSRRRSTRVGVIPDADERSIVLDAQEAIETYFVDPDTRGSYKRADVIDIILDLSPKLGRWSEKYGGDAVITVLSNALPARYWF